MAHTTRSTSSSRLACILWASRAAGCWIITGIGISSLVSPTLTCKICRIRQSFSRIILPLFAPRRLYCSQTENLSLHMIGRVEGLSIWTSQEVAHTLLEKDQG